MTPEELEAIRAYFVANLRPLEVLPLAVAEALRREAARLIDHAMAHVERPQSGRDAADETCDRAADDAVERVVRMLERGVTDPSQLRLYIPLRRGQCWAFSAPDLSDEYTSQIMAVDEETVTFITEAGVYHTWTKQGFRATHRRMYLRTERGEDGLPPEGEG